MSDSHNFVTRTLDRNLLWSVQTPQIFRSDIIVHAYEHNDEDVTDDASLVERLKHKVQLYMGSYNNIKITTSDDILLAENIARTL
jgi:2-C-methyl-D-erythritol 4-phosphate cytidylyltransferase